MQESREDGERGTKRPFYFSFYATSTI